MSQQIPLSQLKRVAELDAEDARQVKLIAALMLEALEYMVNYYETSDHAADSEALPSDHCPICKAEAIIQKAKEIL